MTVHGLFRQTYAAKVVTSYYLLIQIGRGLKSGALCEKKHSACLGCFCVRRLLHHHHGHQKKKKKKADLLLSLKTISLGDLAIAMGLAKELTHPCWQITKTLVL